MTTEPDPLSARLLIELEPGVEHLLQRHLSASQMWLPHTFTPWSTAYDYDGPLGGQAWQCEQSTLPRPVQDALVVNLLTEDNLPGYHFELATEFGREGAWGAWGNRWTAEEGRHADALRSYLHATRAVDPVELEHQRMRHVGTGYTSHHPSLLHGLAYVTVQELATREAHRNAGKACQDPLGEQLMTRIAADENLHMLFYRDLYAQAIQLAPDAAVQSLADVICRFTMPGVTIPGFGRRALRIAAAGIYNLDIHRDYVLLPLLRHLGVMTRSGLGPSGEEARDRISHHLERLSAQAERFRRLLDRMESADHATC
ncbi:acyl-ACP desaturase [Streptomyces huasconensis]|uniref:acyl-ACP desaturase n=1 Tax=Streptomyces huasconensis TaxID=1854574 RepID=UPI0036F71180